MATKKIKDLTKKDLEVICKEHLCCQGCPLKQTIGQNRFYHCDTVEAYVNNKKDYASIEEFVAKLFNQEIEV